MNVFPDFDSLSGIGDLKVVIGAMLTIILIVAVLMIIVSAFLWAIATSTGNPTVAAKASAGVFIALGAAILAGGGVTWMNWLIQLGEQL
ncbi:hypothetical protein ESZ53_01400 [Salinibacterium sp. UTAS2018]|uniref:DUF6112 family protein n=1 Tax=Salinibacterium sp. UTAS2018 TaxID=2508880 RepID=UPI0010097BB4|nr:DUF6112 family protein [Salinibacterium sp. UTAS2018]QAV69213.1 hypothetical protein ESZ53_01400 [Salinibacterium sp. UTAS2018]